MAQETQAHYQAFIGFDVSKETITVYHSRTQQTEEIANTPKALARYVRGLDKSCLAICEPTGGYEAALLKALIAGSVPTHRADARRVKAFIRSLGIRGKTDAIDAKALAVYGQERHARLPLWRIKAEKQQELSALVGRRQELSSLRTAEKNRQQAPVVTRQIKSSCQRILKLLEQEIADIEDAIQRIINADRTLRKVQRTLRSVSGVGPVVAATLIASMPELGTLSRRQAAALAGLAPHPRQSGKHEGYRRVSGGRLEIKKVLFMAALVAARRNPDLRAFYHRLVENGKKPIVAITALMRKLITILNAKVRELYASEQVS